MASEGERVGGLGGRAQARSKLVSIDTRRRLVVTGRRAMTGVVRLDTQLLRTLRDEHFDGAPIITATARSGRGSLGRYGESSSSPPRAPSCVWRIVTAFTAPAPVDTSCAAAGFVTGSPASHARSPCRNDCGCARRRRAAQLARPSSGIRSRIVRSPLAGSFAVVRSSVRSVNSRRLE
jgi:hypothetical protein